jgi:DnaJ-class molecular chaperone
MLEVLGLTRLIISAAADKRKTIRAAMRSAALRHHPDKVGAMGDGDMMKRINEAYDTLTYLYA